MWWLTAGWLRCRPAAAREKDAWRTTSAKVRTWMGDSSMGHAVSLIVCIPTIHFPHGEGRGTVTAMMPSASETTITIRDATLADADAICRIYNQGIEDRVATLETETRTPAEPREWLSTRGPRHPVLAAKTTQPLTISNRPPTARAEHAPPAAIGWASLNRFNPRPAYD